MATDRSRRLRDLAQYVAEGLPSEIDEVLLTGSVSRGVADDLSDVELLLSGEALPPVAVVARRLSAFDQGAFEGGDGWWVGAVVEGEPFELIAWSCARVEARLSAIEQVEIVDHDRIRIAEAIVHGVPLRSAGACLRWQERLRVYPDGLATAIVRDAVGDWMEQTGRGLRSLQRAGSRLALTQQVCADTQNVLRIVFALNGMWEPSWKRLPEILEPLAAKPERLAERIDAALVASDVRETRRLARETLDLAPDTPWVRQSRAMLDETLAALA